MAKKSENKIQGILLLIAGLALLINIPLIEEKTIATIIVLGVALYNLIKK